MNSDDNERMGCFLMVDGVIEINDEVIEDWMT
jgi:hypothetical protein